MAPAAGGGARQAGMASGSGSSPGLHVALAAKGEARRSITRSKGLGWRDVVSQAELVGPHSVGAELAKADFTFQL